MQGRIVAPQAPVGVATASSALSLEADVSRRKAARMAGAGPPRRSGWQSSHRSLPAPTRSSNSSRLQSEWPFPFPLEATQPVRANGRHAASSSRRRVVSHQLQSADCRPSRLRPGTGRLDPQRTFGVPRRTSDRCTNPKVRLIVRAPCNDLTLQINWASAASRRTYRRRYNREYRAV